VPAGESGRRTLTVLADGGLDDGTVLLTESGFVGDLGPAGAVRHEVRVRAMAPLAISVTAVPYPVESADTSVFQDPATQPRRSTTWWP
jgi:hypothetical protein